MESLDGPGAYQGALQADVTTFGLKSTLNGAIFTPQRLSQATLIEDSDEEIDVLSISVGGKHDFNLAYVPKNRYLKAAEGMQFSRAKDVRIQFFVLGYGEQMSDLLFRKATSLLLQEKSVALMFVQRSLLLEWKAVSGRSKVPLTFQKRKCFRRTKDAFLIFSDGVLMQAKSKNLTKNVSLGLKINFAQASLATEKTRKEILTETKVTSIFDAICHLTGKQLDFHKEGHDWYKPTAEGMLSIMGALKFLHVILAGKVKPWGKFKDAVPAFCRLNPILQSVCFDLPIPYGILYSTHGVGLEPCMKTPVAVYRPRIFRVRWDRWDCGRNYEFPVIVGGPDDDVEERGAIFPGENNSEIREDWERIIPEVASRNDVPVNDNVGMLPPPL